MAYDTHKYSSRPPGTPPYAGKYPLASARTLCFHLKARACFPVVSFCEKFRLDPFLEWCF